MGRDRVGSGGFARAVRVSAWVSALWMGVWVSAGRGSEGVSGSGAASASASGAGSPNIVMLFADDLGWGDVGYQGRREWGTPHLDALAESGARFDRFYTAGVVCSPSRAALLTGKSTIHCGVWRNNHDLPFGETTFAEALRERGYATGLFGKWHHGAPRASSPGGVYTHPMDQGFDEFFGFTNAGHAWEKFPKELWDGRELKPSEGYCDDLFTDRAIDFARRRAKEGRPFLLYVPYTATHFHIEAPSDEVEARLPGFGADDPHRELKASYAAMVTRLDANIGRLLGVLDELGLRENTLIAFASDHGATFESGSRDASFVLDSNGPLRGQKRTLWEGGVRVPGILSWKGRIAPGTRIDWPAQTIDLFPTFLAAAGGEPRAEWKVDGVNLLPALTEGAAAPDRTLFWEWRAEGYHQLAAMRGNNKLVITQQGPPELYDVALDPAERRNTIATRREVAEGLRRELEAWIATEVEDDTLGPRPAGGGGGGGGGAATKKAAERRKGAPRG